MNSAADSFVLSGAHVLDAEQGIDRVADVHVADGKIEFVGSRDAAPGAKVIDVIGSLSQRRLGRHPRPRVRHAWALPIPTASASTRA